MYLNYSEMQPSFNTVKWYTAVKILRAFGFCTRLRAEEYRDRGIDFPFGRRAKPSAQEHGVHEIISYILWI